MNSVIDRFSLKNKVAVITGGAGLLGVQHAKTIAEQGGIPLLWDVNTKESKVIAALIRKCIERQDPYPVWGDGEDLKDFLFIDDFISGLLIAFETIDEFEAINIASSIPVTIKEVLNTILEVDNYNSANIQYDSSMPTMLPKRLINTDKIRKMSNWEPKVPLNEGLKITIDWYREYYRNTTPEDKYHN